MALYWRLSLFYLFYFATLGAFLPYWGPYLQARGFDAPRIGALMAAIGLTKIVAPNLWAWIADRSGRRMRIVRLAALAAGLLFAATIAAPGFAVMLAVMLAFSFFWNAALPQFEATTLAHLGPASHRYPQVRLWGSIGFILAVAGLGWVLQVVDVIWLPWLILPLFAGIWLAALRVPDKAAAAPARERVGLARILRRGPVVSLLLAAFLVQASHGPYYSFFTLYLEAHDFEPRTIGLLWALGVVVEILLFLVLHRILPRLGARALLLAATALSALRWWLIAAFVTVPALLVLAQTLHAASFGIVHAVSIYLVHRCFTAGTEGRGQALYSSLSFGAGGAVGSYASGWLWDAMGPAAPFYAAALVALLAFVVVAVGLRERV